MIENFDCNDFIFDANFDSGNLGKVELAKLYNEGIEKTVPDNVIDIEFNLWTKPDCGGTPWENSNRTWFFFSITGGRPYQVVKINVMNLNKQAKLFSQGMHPVIRIGPNGKWERIKDKPAYFMTNESFILTFLHRNSENPDSVKIYYAFTFPYTYTEQQDQLLLYDERYAKDTTEINAIIKEIQSESTNKKVVKQLSDTNSNSNNSKVSSGEQNAKTTETVLEEQIFSTANTAGQKTIEIYSCDSQTSVTCTLEYLRNNFEIKSTEEILRTAETPATTLDENTSESMQHITNLVNNVKIELQQKQAENESLLSLNKDEKSDKPVFDLCDEIYYHRELLIRSYEGRRVDLLTITSFHGITDKREERIPTLFPEFLTPRCHVFKNKKVIFISSRVHPGETPASFVLNGFLSMLLDKKNIVAQTLRKMYVFKIVPFLNPDGVYNGLYRSDLLGHNLNRVYLNPNKDTQPSIYAARKLLRFHHFGYDKPENEKSALSVIAPLTPIPPIREHTISPILCEQNIESNMTAYSGGDTCETVDREIQLQIPTASTFNSYEFEDCDENATDLGLFSEVHSSRENSTSSGEEPKLTSFILPSSSSKSAPLATKRQSSLQTISTGNKPLLPSHIPRPNTSNSVRSVTSNKSASIDKVALKNSINKAPSSPLPTRVGSGAVVLKKPEKRDSKKSLTEIKTSANARQPVNPAQLTHHFRSHRNDYNVNTKNLNISLDFLTEVDEKGEKCLMEENSGLFLYLDLHGHASKKGVFMYGNHLPTTVEAVECMLLPRLMSMNSLHFHFDACNFSEKNMYLKGKRDGLSKEGSGRVAIYKMTGLIKCYTLESNYNTGKYVNILPPKGKDIGNIPTKTTLPVPPKYTPAAFEEVGRALGPSILDLTGSNPTSRLQNSEYRNLQGLRNAMRTELERGSIRGRSASKVSKPRTKRTGNAPQQENKEVSKENKLSTSVKGVAGNSNSNNNNNNQSLTSSTSSNNNSNGNRLQSTGSKLGRKTFSKSNFVKKDSTNSIGNTKKTKVLGESSTSGALKMDRNNKDSNQIPRKKIKVSPQHRIETTEPLITCFGETSIKYTNAVDSFDMCFPSNITTSTFSSSSLPNFFTQTPNLVDAETYTTANKKVKSHANTLDLDDSLDAVPCCSYSLPSTSEPTLTAMRTNSLHTITRTKEFKSKFSKATSSKQQSKVTKTGENGKSKLKKKRTLRADSALKRKKNRVKPVIC